MNSSTDIRDKIEVALKGEAAALVRDGEGVEMIVPPDLAVTTRATGDLVRCWGIRRVTDLLRIVLAYAMCDWSLRLVGAWCVLIEMADGAHLVRRWPCLALDQLAVGHLARRAHPRPVPHPLAGRNALQTLQRVASPGWATGTRPTPGPNLFVGQALGRCVVGRTHPSQHRVRPGLVHLSRTPGQPLAVDRLLVRSTAQPRARANLSGPGARSLTQIAAFLVRFPRKRPQQLARARAFLLSLSVCLRYIP